MQQVTCYNKNRIEKAILVIKDFLDRLAQAHMLRLAIFLISRLAKSASPIFNLDTYVSNRFKFYAISILS